MKSQMKVFAGNSNRPLADRIAAYLNLPLGQATVGRFPDGEIDIKVNEDVRGCDVYVVQSTCPPVNENLMELLVMVDCMRRASSDRVTAVVPYFGYARQDRKAEGRVPITAKLVANLLTEAGADRVLTVDLHAAQIQGFFDIPLDHLFAAPVMVEHLRNLRIPNLCVMAPDLGGVKMARGYAKRLNADLAIIDKRRSGPTETEVLNIIGEVRGKNILLIDDMISTGTSIAQGARAVREAGAARVLIAATHPVLSGEAARKIKQAEVEGTIVTDTIPLRDDAKDSGITVLSVASLLGEAIQRIHRSESVSSLFM